MFGSVPIRRILGSDRNGKRKCSCFLVQWRDVTPRKLSLNNHLARLESGPWTHYHLSKVGVPSKCPLVLHENRGTNRPGDLAAECLPKLFLRLKGKIYPHLQSRYLLEHRLLRPLRPRLFPLISSYSADILMVCFPDGRYRSTKWSSLCRLVDCSTEVAKSQ